MSKFRAIAAIIRRHTTLDWTCQGGGGCGTSNPDDATQCGGCGRPW